MNTTYTFVIVSLKAGITYDGLNAYVGTVSEIHLSIYFQ